MRDLADHYHMIPLDQVTTLEAAKDGHAPVADVVLTAGTRVWGFGRRHFVPGRAFSHAIPCRKAVVREVS
jgi:hypothetical protein